MKSRWSYAVALLLLAASGWAQTDLHDWNNVKNIRSRD